MLESDTTNTSRVITFQFKDTISCNEVILIAAYACDLTSDQKLFYL